MTGSAVIGKSTGICSYKVSTDDTLVSLKIREFASSQSNYYSNSFVHINTGFKPDLVRFNVYRIFASTSLWDSWDFITIYNDVLYYEYPLIYFQRYGGSTRVLLDSDKQILTDNGFYVPANEYDEINYIAYKFT